jgi:putative colanic acid biosynthesis UDP-glucose lipid carrier transferase
MSMVQLLIDALMIAGGALLAWFYLLPFNANGYEYTTLVTGVVVLSAMTISSFGLYRSFRAQQFFEWLGRITTAWLTIILLVLVGLWAVKLSEEFSRLWLGVWFVSVWFGLVLWRVVAHAVLHRLRSKGYDHKKIVIVGAGSLGLSIAQKVEETAWAGFEVVAFFDDKVDKVGRNIQGVSVLAANELASWLEKHSVDEVWFALPLRAEKRLYELLHALRHSTVNIRYVPNLTSLRLLNHAPREVLGFSMLDLSVSPMSEPVHRLLKSIEDKLLASFIIVLISPVLIAIALAIKLTSKGPIFFRQARLGIDGKRFEVLKFRSMVVHQEVDGKVTQATTSDHRITPLGNWLRKTSLDELPQFFNVLKGDMSIVGPRPHAVAHNDYYKDQVDSYMRRHKVKPGITGWAQVHGWRGETDTLEKMEKRVEYDLWYIEHWSLWLDLSIIAMTVFKGFVHENAR